MTNEDRARISAYYDGLAVRFGDGPGSADAVGEETLHVRYRVLTGVTDLSGKRVLDVGCGTGGLGAYLGRESVGVEYTGIDISRGAIEAGRHAHSELRLIEADVLDWNPDDEYDVVLAQGIFYLLEGDAETKMRRLIDRMFGLAREAAAFCTISAWHAGDGACEFRADPIRLAEYCGGLTRRLVVRHDYHPGDVAVYMYKTA